MIVTSFVYTIWFQNLLKKIQIRVEKPTQMELLMHTTINMIFVSALMILFLANVLLGLKK